MRDAGLDMRQQLQHGGVPTANLQFEIVLQRMHGGDRHVGIDDHFEVDEDGAADTTRANVVDGVDLVPSLDGVVDLLCEVHVAGLHDFEDRGLHDVPCGLEQQCGDHDGREVIEDREARVRDRRSSTRRPPRSANGELPQMSCLLSVTPGYPITYQARNRSRE